jgi:hypothetical protein
VATPEPRLGRLNGAHARHSDAGGCGQVFGLARCGVPVHPHAEGVTQDRPVVAAIDRAVNRSGHRWRKRHQDDFAAFATHA